MEKNTHIINKENVVIENIKKEIMLSASIAIGNFLRDIGNKICEIAIEEIKKSRGMGKFDSSKI
ncbi:MAG: hypothetical protein N2749_00860 [Clostridia bacterium]|nr:hypothetical protein [Clostridia bacterium]